MAHRMLKLSSAEVALVARYLPMLILKARPDDQARIELLLDKMDHARGVSFEYRDDAPTEAEIEAWARQAGEA